MVTFINFRYAHLHEHMRNQTISIFLMCYYSVFRHLKLLDELQVCSLKVKSIVENNQFDLTDLFFGNSKKFIYQSIRVQVPTELVKGQSGNC